MTDPVTRLRIERELLRRLDLPQLEALAVDSQALMDKAVAMAKAPTGTDAD